MSGRGWKAGWRLRLSDLQGRLRGLGVLFWLCVVGPTLIAAVHFGLIASDVYVSESRFVVRGIDAKTESPLGALLKGAGLSPSREDGYTVRAYILSRDAMHALHQASDLRAVFGKADLLSRFPGLDWDDSLENLHRYYQRRVDVQIDPAASVLTLTVRAFTAQDARDINRRLLELSEELINRLNERARHDLILAAAREVELAEQRARAAALALADYRNRKGVIDPEREALIPLQQIAKLQDELLATRAQLEQLLQTARDNPQIPVLRRRIDLLEREIEREATRVAGGGAKSLASKAAEYQRLVLEKEFADRQLASAMASLEQARQEAQRQQLYLERIAEPLLPDAAMEPRRVRNVLTTFALGLVAWGVLSLLVAGVKEHLD